MATATSQELTLHLPRELVEMVQDAAHKRLEAPDAIVAEGLRSSMQPLRQEALRRLRSQVRQQQQAQSPWDLRARLEAHLTGAEEQRLSQLLELNRTDALTEAQQAELRAFFGRIEAVATEKPAALWLLSDRQTDPPAT